MAAIPQKRSRARLFEYSPLARNQEVAVVDDRGLVVRGDGRVLLVDWGEGGSFTEQELPFLLTLLEAWPNVCPYEKLLVLLAESRDEARSEQLSLPALSSWQQAEAFQEQLADVRALLSNMQPRLALLGLQIVAKLEEGLLLRPVSPSPRFSKNLVSFAHHRAKKAGREHFGL